MANRSQHQTKVSNGRLEARYIELSTDIAKTTRNKMEDSFDATEENLLFLQNPYQTHKRKQGLGEMPRFMTN